MRPVASKYAAVGENAKATGCVMVIRMDCWEYGVKLALMTGAMTNRKAPVRVMAFSIFRIIFSILLCPIG